MDADVIVIGSGFGGSVAACRLAEKGHKVIVLERGRRWTKDTYPSVKQDGWFWSETKPELFNGWIDIGVYKDMSVARGAGVGGGSLIYANVSIEAKPDVFESGWPREISYAGLKPYYDRVGAMLDVQKLPENQYTDRYRIMEQGAHKLGYGTRFGAIDLAVSFDKDWHYGLDDPFHEKHSKTFTNKHGVEQGTCIHCGNCDIGCKVQAKNTLDLNYLAVAERHGTEIRPLHLVNYIQPISGGYRVNFDELIDGDRKPGHVDAVRVIVAAGSMGSTELLLRSKHEFKSLPNISQRLGHGWSANGDFVTAAVQGEDALEASPTQGPTISSAIDLLDGVYEGEKLFIEDGGLPDILGNVLEQKRHWWQRLFLFRYGKMIRSLNKAVRNRDPFSRVMVWFGQAVDAADGRLYLGRAWYAPWHKRIKLKWDVKKSMSAIKAMEKMHLALADATGGLPIVPPTWTVARDLITPHPLGGCAMAEDAEHGVVNHKGEVFNYPGLYVADGAVIPRALGLNPSRTIAALSERMCDLMA